MERRFQSGRGFLLAEVLVVLVISAAVAAALLTGMVALVRLLQPAEVRVAGQRLPVAPSFGAFPAAVRLHEALLRHVSTARAVYVFGGTHPLLTHPAAAADRPLGLRGLPPIEGLARGLAMNALRFHELYAAELGAYVISPAPDDFSVLVIGEAEGRLVPSCFVQVNRDDVFTWDGEVRTSYTRRRVELWEHGAPESLHYAFLEKADRVSAFVGAVHTWLRHGGDTAQAEEGPACVAFPDPWVHARRDAPDSAPPFSRFSYFLAVSP